MFKLVPKSVSDGLFHLVQKNTNIKTKFTIPKPVHLKKTDSDASWHK